MATRVWTDSPDKIQFISDLVHDRWLDVEAVRYDKQDSTLVIPISSASRSSGRLLRRLGIFDTARPAEERSSLSIHHVVEYSIIDTERVRFYDLAALLFDPKAMKVEIRTGVPLRIEALVKKFGLSVELSNEIGQGSADIHP
jgi:hypothetical protein